MDIDNGSTPTLVFLLVDATDDETAETGLSPVVQISKNGGGFTNTTNSATAISNGWYKVVLTATETNTNGPLICRSVVAGTTDEWRDVHQVITPVATTAQLTTAVEDITEHSDLAGGVAKAGSTVSILVLADIDDKPYADYVGYGVRFLYEDGHEEYRAVTSHDTLNGTVTLNRPLNVAPTTTTEYVLAPAANDVLLQLSTQLASVSTFDPASDVVSLSAVQLDSLFTALSDLPASTTTAMLTRALTVAVAADTATPTLQQMLVMIGASLGLFKMTVIGTTISVYAPNKTTLLMQWTLDDPDAPTTRTRSV
jgi:hypothetical protein